MAWIVYTYLSKDGEELRSNGLFDTVEQLDHHLSLRGENIIDLHQFPEFVFYIKEQFASHLQEKEVAEFARMLAMYVSGGIDLHLALEDMQQSAGSTPIFKRVAGQLKSYLTEGYRLSEAMEKSREFPDEVLSLCKIGEESGNLDTVLNEAAKHIERVIVIRSTAKRAMIYPAFTVSVILFGAYFWLSVVIPKIAEVFANIDTQLPDNTIALMQFAVWARDQWWLFLLVIVTVPTLFMLLRRHEEFRYHTDRLAWYSPIFGKIVQGSQMTFYFQYLGLLYKAGVPITTAIETMTYAMSNRFMRRNITSMIEHLRSGNSLLESLHKTGIYEPLTLRMVGIGEETGNLDGQLQKLGDIYFHRVNGLVDVLAKTMEPVLIILMALIFGFFLVAIIGPIYETIGNIGAVR